MSHLIYSQLKGIKVSYFKSMGNNYSYINMYNNIQLDYKYNNEYSYGYGNEYNSTIRGDGTGSPSYKGTGMYPSYYGKAPSFELFFSYRVEE